MPQTKQQKRMGALDRHMKELKQWYGLASTQPDMYRLKRSQVVTLCEKLGLDPEEEIREALGLTPRPESMPVVKRQPRKQHQMAPNGLLVQYQRELDDDLYHPLAPPAIMPKPVTGLDVAFGGNMSELLPTWDDIPNEFKSYRNPYAMKVSDWFFKGINQSELIAKPNLPNRSMALAHLRAILSSFEPQHEHKEAGVAYLMSLWFDLAE